jgi:hypothetical protein
MQYFMAAKNDKKSNNYFKWIENQKYLTALLIYNVKLCQVFF